MHLNLLRATVYGADIDASAVARNFVLSGTSDPKCEGLFFFSISETDHFLPLGGYSPHLSPQVNLEISREVERNYLFSLRSIDSFRASEGIPSILAAGFAVGGWGAIEVVWREFEVPQGLLVYITNATEHLDILSSEIIDSLTILLAGVVGGVGRHSRTNLAPKPERLTDRQLNVLRSMATGLTNYQIGRKFNISESSVKQESMKIYRFLKVANRTAAVHSARMLGLLESAGDLETSESEVAIRSNME